MATAEWADVWIEILSYLGIAWFAAGALLRVITGFGVIVDIIAIPLAAAPDKIYRTIKRNDSRIFRHIRQIQSLMQIYGKFSARALEAKSLNGYVLQDPILHKYYIFPLKRGRVDSAAEC